MLLQNGNNIHVKYINFCIKIIKVIYVITILLIIFSDGLF